MNRMRRAVILAAAGWLATYSVPLAADAAARVEYHDGLPIVFLSGTPYELGRQHGELLRDEVRRSVAGILGYFRRYVKVPLIGGWLVSWWLDRTWGPAVSFIPDDYLEELRGLADGSGVPLRELRRLHAIPDRTYACSSLAAWGPATSDGRLIHTRNLDWNIDVGIQDFAAVFVVRPQGKRAFINLGWAGFIGVLSGLNDQQLSIGQIGAESTDVTSRGLPMVFLMRRILEESDTLEDAAALIREAPRTVGVNYVIADADARRAIAVETTHRYAEVFEADDPKEHGVVYARPMAHVVFRADAAIDPDIRAHQLASNGDPSRPGLEDPAGSSAYDVRYLGQAEGMRQRFGQLDEERVLEVVATVAPSSNVQSVVFAWPDLWVANAQGATRAAQTPYHRLRADELLGVSEAVP